MKFPQHRFRSDDAERSLYFALADRTVVLGEEATHAVRLNAVRQHPVSAQ